MPVTIHIIRHGEGYHNVSDENKGMRDPSLTEKGEAQCRHACETFPYHDKIVRLFASPLTRTLQTCILSFRTPDFVKTHPPAKIIALQEFQEVSALPYDLGLHIDEIDEKFGGIVDLNGVQEDWFECSKKTDKSSWEKQEEALFSRGRNARSALQRAIKDLPEDAHVGLASHGTFLHFATNDFSGLEPGMTTGWANTEWRSYKFDNSLGDDGAPVLIETKDSWARRYDSDERPSGQEQEERQKYLLSKMRHDYHDEC